MEVKREVATDIIRVRTRQVSILVLMEVKREHNGDIHRGSRQRFQSLF